MSSELTITKYEWENSVRRIVRAVMSADRAGKTIGEGQLGSQYIEPEDKVPPQMNLSISKIERASAAMRRDESKTAAMRKNREVRRMVYTYNKFAKQLVDHVLKPEEGHVQEVIAPIGEDDELQ
jgi:hypothetical protein